MPSLIFYRQKRVDGGIRTGVELEGETIVEEFEEGDQDRDPALVWYVDLRCEGTGLSVDPNEALEWLISQQPEIVQGFHEFAKECEVGTDADSYPIQWGKFSGLPEGVAMEIACSAIRRITAREISKILKDVGDHWTQRLRGLGHPLNVSR